ncbi:hypothetical protein VTK73DRAFT_10408 [Phialemonium thermophilum]|uniref:Uncharacterized protein n=1 Tax=Phialemonium thermophilum TaxID=223376 RepID=A0ABR3VWX4_9PEZI
MTRSRGDQIPLPATCGDTWAACSRLRFEGLLRDPVAQGGLHGASRDAKEARDFTFALAARDGTADGLSWEAKSASMGFLGRMDEAGRREGRGRETRW